MLRNMRQSNKTTGPAKFCAVAGKATGERAPWYACNTLEWCITGQTNFGAWQSGNTGVLASLLSAAAHPAGAGYVGPPLTKAGASVGAREASQQPARWPANLSTAAHCL